MGTTTRMIRNRCRIPSIIQEGRRRRQDGMAIRATDARPRGPPSRGVSRQRRRAALSFEGERWRRRAGRRGQGARRIVDVLADRWRCGRRGGMRWLSKRRPLLHTAHFPRRGHAGQSDYGGRTRLSIDDGRRVRRRGRPLPARAGPSSMERGRRGFLLWGGGVHHAPDRRGSGGQGGRAAQGKLQGENGIVLEGGGGHGVHRPVVRDRTTVVGVAGGAFDQQRTARAAELPARVAWY